jgi:hypothetical protein
MIMLALVPSTPSTELSLPLLIAGSGDRDLLRFLAKYRARISAPEAVPELSDFAVGGAPEFSEPALGPYAIVDLR